MLVVPLKLPMKGNHVPPYELYTTSEVGKISPSRESMMCAMMFVKSPAIVQQALSLNPCPVSSAGERNVSLRSESRLRYYRTRPQHKKMMPSTSASVFRIQTSTCPLLFPSTSSSCAHSATTTVPHPHLLVKLQRSRHVNPPIYHPPRLRPPLPCAFQFHLANHRSVAPYWTT